MTAEPFWPGDRSPLYQPGSAKFVGTLTVPFLLSVNTESGTETPIIGIERGAGGAARLDLGSIVEVVVVGADIAGVTGIVVVVVVVVGEGITTPEGGRDTT